MQPTSSLVVLWVHVGTERILKHQSTQDDLLFDSRDIWLTLCCMNLRWITHDLVFYQSICLHSPLPQVEHLLTATSRINWSLNIYLSSRVFFHWPPHTCSCSAAGRRGYLRLQTPSTSYRWIPNLLIASMFPPLFLLFKLPPLKMLGTTLHEAHYFLKVRLHSTSRPWHGYLPALPLSAFLLHLPFSSCRVFTCVHHILVALHTQGINQLSAHVLLCVSEPDVPLCWTNEDEWHQQYP